MKKMLGLLLTAVTLVALVPRNASAGENSSSTRCDGIVISGQCHQRVPFLGGKKGMPPVQGQGGKQSLPPVKR